MGACPVRPSKKSTGLPELKKFIIEVMDHFQNRISQREQHAFGTYKTHKNERPCKLNDLLPEAYGKSRDFMPEDIHVLIGYYHKNNYDWINKNKRYNFRTGKDKGSLILDKEVVSARYLLLHSAGDKTSGNLWKIVSKGPKIYTKQDLLNEGYDNPRHDYYLVIDIEKVTDPEFQDKQWDFKKLKGYRSGRQSTYAFTATLSEVMEKMVRDER